MKKKTPSVLSFFLLFLTAFNSHSQSETFLNASQKDSITLKFDSYKTQIFELIDVSRDYEKALALSSEAIKEFQNHPTEKGHLQQLKGMAFDYLGIDDSSIIYFNKALRYAKGVNDIETEGKLYNDFGIFHFYREQLDSATYYFLKSLKISNTTSDYFFTGALNNNLAVIKGRQEKYNEAISYYLEAISLYNAEEKSPMIAQSIIHCYYNLSECYLQLHKITPAMAISDQIYSYCISNNDSIMLLDILAFKSAIFQETGNYRSSVNMGLKVYKMSAIFPNFDPTTNYMNLGESYRELSLYDSSIFFNELGLKYAKETNNERNTILFRENLEFVYTDMEDFENAYLHLKATDTLYDRNEKIAQFEKMEEMESKFQNEKKQHEILLLKQENSIQILYIFILFIVLSFGLLITYFILRKRRLAHQLAISKEKQKVSKSILVGQENERQRIAIDLHDSVSASLANLAMRVHNFRTQPEAISEELITIENDIRITYKEVRSISHNLAPYKIEQEGLIFAIDDLVFNCNKSGTTVFKSNLFIREDQIDLLTKSILYRIIQELTLNILKHSQATQSSIHMEIVAGEIILQVSDNGIGFEETHSKQGIGLNNIKTRIQYLNGKMERIAKIGYGVLYTITIPISQFESK